MNIRRHFFGILLVALSAMTGSAYATSIVLDGNFLQPIGTGSTLIPWADWTDAGITRNSAPDDIQGNYARLPTGADLFQRFDALGNGGYVLSFLVRNQSPTEAKLVLAIQEALGTPRSIVFAAGTGEEISLSPSDHFTSETLTFYIDDPSFVPNELAFSNSYDAPVYPIEDSLNPTGSVIDIADVTLCPLSSYPCGITPYIPQRPVAEAPEPATWAMMLFGLVGVPVSRQFGKRGSKLCRT